MKKINNFQILLVFLGILCILYLFNSRYKERYRGYAHSCSQVADDDRCNKRKECEWVKGGCERWAWGRGGRRVCMKYAEYCKNRR